MQSEAEAVRAAESCVLGQAERHVEDTPTTGGKCWKCDHFREIQASECLPTGVRRQLTFCGACVADERSIEIVDRGEWHSADECFEGGSSDGAH